MCESDTYISGKNQPRYKRKLHVTTLGVRPFRKTLPTQSSYFRISVDRQLRREVAVTVSNAHGARNGQRTSKCIVLEGTRSLATRKFAPEPHTVLLAASIGQRSRKKHVRFEVCPRWRHIPCRHSNRIYGVPSRHLYVQTGVPDYQA